MKMLDPNVVPKQRYELYGWVGLVFGFILGMLAMLAVISTVPEATASCFENEVVAWDGDGHTQCVPLDDLLADEVIVDLDYCYTPNDERGWIWSCKVDPYATLPEEITLP